MILMQLTKDELKVLKYCSEEVLWENDSPKTIGFDMNKEELKRIMDKLVKLGLIYRDNEMSEKTAGYLTMLEGDKYINKHNAENV